MATTVAAEIPKVMKALIKNAEKESYEYTEIPVPEPEGDEVLIRVDAVSICGSDIALYKWTPMARVIASVPFIPGHESAGTVVKCGPEATLEIGSRVGVENHFYCGDCYQCANDLREICMNMGQYGHGRKTMHGGCSEYSIVSQKFLYKITANLSPEQITMMEPLGVAHNGLERLKVKDEDVLVIGCGPIGLLAQRLAKVMGAKRVIGADIEDWKLKLATDMGTDIVVNTKDNDLKEFIMELTGGAGIGRICECSGVAAVANSCFSYLRKGGRVVLIGLPKQPLHFENPLPDILFKCLTIKTVHGRKIYHTWAAVEALLADRKVDVGHVISHRIPMSQFEDAFKMGVGPTATTPKNLVLYIHGLSAPSRAVWMAAKAANIPVTIRYLDLFKGEHKTPEFAKINPDTTVPTLQDGDFSLWESRPIMTYLVSRYGKNSRLYPKDLQQRAVCDRLLHYDLGSVYKTISEYMYPQLFQAKPPDTDREAAMRKVFDYMNRQLQGQKYMCGDDMTIVDISMATNLALIELRNYKLDQWPLLTTWYQRMKSLPYWAECNQGLYEWKSPMMGE